MASIQLAQVVWEGILLVGDDGRHIFDISRHRLVVAHRRCHHMHLISLQCVTHREHFQGECLTASLVLLLHLLDGLIVAFFLEVVFIEHEDADVQHGGDLLSHCIVLMNIAQSVGSVNAIVVQAEDIIAAQVGANSSEEHVLVGVEADCVAA